MSVQLIQKPFAEALECYLTASKLLCAESLTLGNNPPAYAECVSAVGIVLSEMLNRGGGCSWTQSCDYIHAKMSGVNVELRSNDAKVVAKRVVASLMKAKKNGPQGWIKEFDQLHQQGRDAAKMFFFGCTGSELQARLKIECDVVVDMCPNPGVHYPPHLNTGGNAAMGHLLDSGRHVITVRVPKTWPLALYYCLPMLFKHEYASHVFAFDDNKSPIFNDGWLFLMTCRFMKHQYALGKLKEVTLEQSIAYSAHWLQKQVIETNSTASTGVMVAESLRDAAEGEPLLLDNLAKLTCAMACDASKMPFRNKLIWGLSYGVRHNIPNILELLRNHADPETLLEDLSKKLSNVAK